MTWGMFSIGYLELDNLTDAARLFKKQEGNVAAPYNVRERSGFFFYTDLRISHCFQKHVGMIDM